MWNTLWAHLFTESFSQSLLQLAWGFLWPLWDLELLQMYLMHQILIRRNALGQKKMLFCIIYGFLFCFIFNPTLDLLESLCKLCFWDWVSYKVKGFKSEVPIPGAADQYWSVACQGLGRTAGGELECNALGSSWHWSLVPKKLGTAILNNFCFKENFS